MIDSDAGFGHSREVSTKKTGATDLCRDSRALGAENKEKNDAPSPFHSPTSVIIGHPG